MSNSMNAVKQAIKTYLDNRAKTDELFAVAYAKPNKNIDECFDYIVGEAKKQGGNAVYVSDEVVFGWAVHYYDEDDIKINKLPANTQVSARASVELTDEDKEKAREQAIESFKKDDECECCQDNDKLDFKELFVLAVATSIDALAVGLTFALYPDVNIIPAISIIGIVTFVICSGGVLIGHKFGAKFKSKAEFCGGLVLIIIGLKLLIEGLIA